MERSIVRPVYSNLGNFYIAEHVVGDLVNHIVSEVPGVHRVGRVEVTTTAGKMDLSPSKLTEKLAGADSGGKPRGLTVDELERYIVETDDKSPIYYLVEKYLHDPEIAQQEAMAKLQQTLEALGPLMAAAGFEVKRRRG